MDPVKSCSISLRVVTVIRYDEEFVRLQCIFKDANVYVDIKSKDEIHAGALAELKHDTFGNFTVQVAGGGSYIGNPANEKHRILMVDKSKLHYRIGGTSVGWSCLHKHYMFTNESIGAVQPEFTVGVGTDHVTPLTYC